jgi:hypothetical protein
MAVTDRPSDPKSRHTDESWRDQLERTRRWNHRLQQCRLQFLSDPQTALDYAYAFFMNCYHVKDWLKAAGQPNVEEFVRSSLTLSVCGDLCNGMKHFDLDRARVDNNWRGRAREYNPSGPPTPIPFLLVGGGVHNVFDLANTCVREWERFCTRNANRP